MYGTRQPASRFAELSTSANSLAFTRAFKGVRVQNHAQQPQCSDQLAGR